MQRKKNKQVVESQLQVSDMSGVGAGAAQKAWDWCFPTKLGLAAQKEWDWCFPTKLGLVLGMLVGMI